MLLNRWHITFAARILALILMLLLTYTMIDRSRSDEARVQRELRWIDELNRRASNESLECQVPVLDPWDSSIMKYFGKEAPLKCTPVQRTQVVQLRSGRLFVDPEEASTVECEFRSIAKKENDDFNIVTGDWTPLPIGTDGFPMPTDFVEVKCRKKGLFTAWRTFSHVFASVVPANASYRTNKPFLDASREHPRIVMLGIDSMSRSNFYRQMPLTLKALEKRGGIEFRHHVKVADNTFPNWMAIQTGKRGVTLHSMKAELDDSWNVNYDDFPFIWKDLADQGYATLFAEDDPLIATFNYRGKSLGFFKKPFDHYMRPYYLAITDTLLAQRSTIFCYDSSPLHELQLDYLSSFLSGYAGKRAFAWFWAQAASHDYLNTVGKLDAGFARFISSPTFDDNNTILVVFSDHGHRIDDIRKTLVGRLESRLPFLSIVVPQSIREAHPQVVERLNTNSNLFSTQYDMYQTLVDIKNGTWLKSHNRTARHLQRGYSQFAVKPASRTCAEAEVPPEFCPCFTEVSLNPADGMLPAQRILDHINALLDRQNSKVLDADHPDGIKSSFRCSKLALDSLQVASVRVPPKHVVPLDQSIMPVDNLKLVYRIGFTAKRPSSAQLEAEIEHDILKDSWLVLGDVERNNRYGNTSHCVTDPIIRKLCHCESSR